MTRRDFHFLKPARTDNHHLQVRQRAMVPAGPKHPGGEVLCCASFEIIDDLDGSKEVSFVERYRRHSARFRHAFKLKSESGGFEYDREGRRLVVLGPGELDVWR